MGCGASATHRAAVHPSPSSSLAEGKTAETPQPAVEDKVLSSEWAYVEPAVVKTVSAESPRQQPPPRPSQEKEALAEAEPSKKDKEAVPEPSKQEVATPELSEPDKEEVEATLRRGRVHRSPRALRALTDGASIEEHPPGTVLDGPHAWVGERLVLSGTARVLVTAQELDIEVARLQQGDSLGWDAWQLPAVWEASSVWSRCRPRVEVSEGPALRLCRLPAQEDVEVDADCPSHRHPHRLESRKSTRRLEHRAQTVRLSDEEAGKQHDLSDCLAGLWRSASPPKVGVGFVPAGMVRAHYLAALWGPFLDQLEEHSEEIRRRKARGYRIHDCFPLQGHQIADLARHVMQLTEVWYGSDRGGNLSVLYKWFVEAMETLGVTAYSYSAIPSEKSPDGWAVVVDGGARAAALKGKGSLDAQYVETGGVAQRQGRSAIDNTVLRNVYLPREARELTVGRQLRKFMCKLIALRQRCICTQLSEYLEMDLLWMVQSSHHRGHRVVRSVLRSLSPEDVRAAGVDPEGVCFTELRARGSILAGFGQLEPAEQKVVHEEVRKRLQRLEPETADATSAEPANEFEKLIAWCKDYPGEFFERNKQRHMLVLIAGMFSRKIIVIKRSVMEKFTLARYIPLFWQRKQVLWGCNAAGPFEVRPAAVDEAASVRANECPYTALHAMSLSSGAFEKSFKPREQNLLRELQWIVDPEANIENWYITDIEKIAQESWQLNPHGPREKKLPGEAFVMVGQNPKVGSSIRQTQHTQLCQGSISQYPVLRIAPQTASRNSPTSTSRMLGPDSLLEVVDVGPAGAPAEQCGLMIRITTEKPTSPEVIRFLVELRVRIMSALGGGECVDFLSLTLSDEEGRFVLILAPLPQLVKIGDAHPDLANWVNPLTGESSEVAGLEETRIDFGKGVGHFLVAKPALREQLLKGGEETLRRIWAFNRVPGVREIVDSFMLEWNILEGDGTSPRWSK